ncbi:MAG: hypothetical protein ACRDPR_02840, partial [Nocardioidaceae bacterium]
MHFGRLAVPLLVAIGAFAFPIASADDYSDPEYAHHDADNIERSRGRHEQMLTPEYGMAGLEDTLAEYPASAAEQAGDLSEGRVYPGFGRVLPGGSAGDGQDHDGLLVSDVAFFARTGARIEGRLWRTFAPGPRPGIVITTGSIQAPAASYEWAARSLARAGYFVLTFDVQGQGDSEGLGHEPGVRQPT